MVARYLPGQEQTGPPKGGGRMRMLGGDSTGEATGLGGGGPSAQRPEGGCLPCRGGTQLGLAALGGCLVMDSCLSCCNNMDVVGCYMYEARGCAPPGW